MKKIEEINKNISRANFFYEFSPLLVWILRTGWWIRMFQWSCQREDIREAPRRFQQRKRLSLWACVVERRSCMSYGIQLCMLVHWWTRSKKISIVSSINSCTYFSLVHCLHFLWPKVLDQKSAKLLKIKMLFQMMRVPRRFLQEQMFSEGNPGQN